MSTWTCIPSGELKTLRGLYRRGLYLQAYEFSSRFGPLEEWRGPARAWAARLARSLGAPRLARLHAWLGWREAPDDPGVREAYVQNVLDRSGPYYAWRELNRLGEPEGAEAEQRVVWYAMHAQVLGMLRDFDRAEAWLERAFGVRSDDPWLYVARAHVRELEDRYEEALEALEVALRIQPWYRPAIQAKAHLLTLAGRDEQAVAVLRQAAERRESCVLWGQLFTIESELERFERCDEYLRQFVAHAPLWERDKSTRAWLAAANFQLAYHRGDFRAAVRYARQTNEPFYKAVADRMEACRFEGRYVRLPVGFVRQHHMTCAPATLSALSRFWGRDANHLEVAEQICYNGTSAYNERRWVAENGWELREFTVTEDAAQRLIDRGVPFTLTTVEPGSGHLQAVIGYDSRRGLLVIRDPYERNVGQARADKFLERYAAFGPRGLAFVPAERRELLADLPLPDVELWDVLHRLDDALEHHDREKAQRCLAEMQQRAADHRLVLEARRRVATYDGNPQGMLQALDELAARYPDNAAVQAGRVSLLRLQSRRDELLETLRGLCTGKQSHPVFWVQYARELVEDARRHREAAGYLRRALRYWPTNARLLETLSRLYWAQQRFDEACELLRFAACLEEKDESAAEAYFLAACARGRRREALRFLWQRFRRNGHASGQPAQTLVMAYVRLSRVAESVKVLQQALRRRPDDGELLLFAAGHYTALHDAARAEECLRSAEGRVPRADWLRRAAQFFRSQGDVRQAMRLIREALDIEPMAPDLHAELSRLLAQSEGPDAAVRHFEAAIERFPHFLPLYQSYIEFLGGAPPAQRERVVRRYLALDPHNAWALRELGVALLDQHRLEEARSVLDLAAKIEPANTASHALLGQWALLSGEVDEARRRFREAVTLSVDNAFAVERLLDTCATRQERQRELAFVRQQLLEQVVSGEAVVTYWSLARNTLPRAELLEQLREGLQARPDIWQLWCLVARQLLVLDRAEKAWDYVERAAKRFPLEARVWLHRADVCRARMDFEGQRRSLERALEIEPTLASAVGDLIVLLRRQGEKTHATAVVERALCLDPTSESLLGLHAVLLWDAGQRERALQQVTRAVEVEPGYEQGWEVLAAWSEEIGEPERAEAVARRLTQMRPGEARSWLVLASVLDEEKTEERLEAVQRAERLAPRSVEVHRQRARVLTEACRFREALAACRPPAWPVEQRPFPLVHTEALILHHVGRQAEARDVLLKGLREDPFNEEGWAVLAEWASAASDGDVLLEAAEALYKLDPHDCDNIATLAQALLAKGKRDRAVGLLCRALQLDPAHERSAVLLCDLHAEAGERDEAWELLQTRVEAGQDSPGLLCRAIEASLNWHGDVLRAARYFDQLCAAELRDSAPVVDAFSAFERFDLGRFGRRRAVARAVRSDWARERGLRARSATELACGILRQRVLDGSGNFGAGRMFGAAMYVYRRRRFARLLPELLRAGAAGRHAAGTFFEIAAERDKARARGMLRRVRSILRADPQLLARLMPAMIEHLGVRFAAQCVGDREPPSGLPADGWFALAYCWLCLGDAERAERAILQAGTASGGIADDARRVLKAAVRLLRDGDAHQAASVVDGVPVEDQPPPFRLYLLLVQAAAALRQPDAEAAQGAEHGQRAALEKLCAAAALGSEATYGPVTGARVLARRVLDSILQAPATPQLRRRARWLRWRLRLRWLTRNW